MPLPRRPQAHHKAQPALRDTSLIRVRHDGRIEKRRRLQRILP